MSYTAKLPVIDEVFKEEYIQFSEKHKMRKQMDAMAQILGNRIALLKQTEIKAFENLTKTQRRNELLILKRERINSEQISPKDYRPQKEELLVLKKDLQKKRVRAVTMMQKKKQKMYQKVKKESEKLKSKKMNEDRQQLIQNYQKSNIIKQQLYIGNIKRQEFKQNLQEQVKKEYFYKRSIEEKLIQQRQKELQILENFEFNLVKNLKNTQQLQNQAVQQMRLILNNTHSCRKQSIFHQFLVEFQHNKGKMCSEFKSPSKVNQTDEIISNKNQTSRDEQINQ